MGRSSYHQHHAHPQINNLEITLKSIPKVQTFRLYTNPLQQIIVISVFRCLIIAASLHCRVQHSDHVWKFLNHVKFNVILNLQKSSGVVLFSTIHSDSIFTCNSSRLSCGMCEGGIMQKACQRASTSRKVYAYARWQALYDMLARSFARQACMLSSLSQKAPPPP